MDTTYASDSEREAVYVHLREALAEGRINQEEHEELVGQAVAARRRGELDKLISDLPNAKLPEPRPERPNPSRPAPKRTATVSSDSALNVVCFLAAVVVFSFLVLGGPVKWMLSGASDPASQDQAPSAPVQTPTPGPSITDPQDRAFVQAMIDWTNSGGFADPAHPKDIDQAAVLDIAHRLRDPKNDVRQTYLLVMDSSAYKSLTDVAKYKAGKLALSIWRPDGEAAWIELGKEGRYE
jgi:hypothetical protein